MDDVRLETLHDHYKETFTYIREREGLRDRLFLVLIGLYALLAIQIQYPIAFESTIGKVNVFGFEVDVSALPLPAFLSITWVLVLAIALRYCQTTLTVERQYEYLHFLEDRISPEFDHEGLYRREGREYERDYPWFKWMAWRFYTFLFPLIGVLATVALIRQELMGLNNSSFTKILDFVVAASIVLCLILYRLVPHEVQRWFTRRYRQSSTEEATRE